MRIEQREGNSVASHSHKHNWGKPLPGAGSMQVCRSCGEKETSASRNSECVGKPAVGLVDTMHDYEPT